MPTDRTLTLFDTPEAASAAYIQAKRRVHPGWVETPKGATNV